MKTQAPGRICLCGEHQDYLDHPVIACAINLFFTFRGEKRRDRRFIIHKRDLKETESFAYPASGLIPYEKKRDYFRSTLNVLRKSGKEIPHGAEVEIWSEIPIAAGAGSSSVMIVTWLRFLSELFAFSDLQDPMALAEAAFQAEVSEFGEPGGKMDHYTSSLGGILFLDFASHRCLRLRDRMEGFILVDSLEKKDTFAGLHKIKGGEIEALSLIREHCPGVSPLDLDEKELHFLPPDLLRYGVAAIVNHRLTWKGKAIFAAKTFDDNAFAQLLNEQQRTFRELFRNTTPKIDRMMETALKNGALGGKMNGSGGGGTIFFYAPGKEKAVMESLRPFDVKIHKVSVVG